MRRIKISSWRRFACLALAVPFAFTGIGCGDPVTTGGAIVGGVWVIEKVQEMHSRQLDIEKKQADLNRGSNR